MCAPAADGRALTLWAERAGGRRDRAFSTADADQLPGFLASFAAISRASCGVSATWRRRPSTTRTAADLIAAAENRPQVPGARQSRRLPPAPMDADGGGRSRRRVVRERAAARHDRGRRHRSDRFSARGRPAAPPSSCCSAQAKGIPSRRAGSSAAAPARWRTRWPRPRGQPAPRSGPAPRSRGSSSRTRRADGRRAGDGRADRRARRSSRTPIRGARCSGSSIRCTWRPSSSAACRTSGCDGTLAKVNYAVSALPRFTGLSARDADQQARALSGCVRLARRPRRASSARSTRRSTAASPTSPGSSWRSRRSPIRRSRPPASTSSRRTCSSRRITSERHDVGRGARSARRRGDAHHRALRAGLRAHRRGARSRSRRSISSSTYGLTGGHIFHGELALDQLLRGAAAARLGALRHADSPHLYLCGSGTHPGTGLDGRSGALAAGRSRAI